MSTIIYNNNIILFGIQLITILDIDIDQPQSESFEAILNSPRTREAMATVGIEPKELDDKPYERLREELMARERKRSIPKVIVDLRYENF